MLDATEGAAALTGAQDQVTVTATFTPAVGAQVPGSQSTVTYQVMLQP